MGWGMGASFALSWSNSRQEFTRLYRYKIELYIRDEYFGIKNKTKFRLEQQIPRASNFRFRFLIDHKLYFKNKWMPLKATPYMAHRIFWFLGGKPLQYWNGLEKHVKQAPNDLHRYRMTAGVRAKATKYVSLNLFYVFQKEFNVGWAPYREINVRNPISNRYNRSFSDHVTWGFSVGYTIPKPWSVLKKSLKKDEKEKKKKSKK
jgi:hypothetical protein